jgi:glucosamine-6-phosphate deaminase
MRICKVKDYAAVSRQAANIISAQVIMKPDCVLGLATGSSPLGVYRQLAEWFKKGDLDFSEVTSINLDEYKGLKADDPQSYRYYMNENLFRLVNIDPSRTFVPDGTEADSEKACSAYDKVIEASGGIDLQLLGIGVDGHIGFNEPSDAFPKGTHCVDLTESTINANKRFFEKAEDVPRQAYTMGIISIIRARKILMVASGKEKAEILYRALTGPIMPSVPASILQLHPDVTVVGDEEALAKFNI